MTVAEHNQHDRSLAGWAAVSGRRDPPSICWRDPFPIEMGCQGFRPPAVARFRAALTADFNRNSCVQEIDGE
jgi:hypothetical protein